MPQIPRRHVRTIWLWSAVAAVAVAAVTAGLLRSRPSTCDAVSSSPGTPVTTRAVTTRATTAPAPPAAAAVVEFGQARYYTFTDGVACSFPSLPLDGFYAGVPTGEYGQAAECGSFLDIQGPRGQVRVEIVDRCPGCGPGQYDLSTAAFTQLADTATGVIPISFSRVHDPSPAAGLSYVVEAGSSAVWLGLLVNDTGNPIQQIAIRPEAGGPWQPLTRGVDNYWTVAGAGAGPFTALVTDLDGHQAQISGIALLPGQVKRTDTLLYTVPAAAEASPAAATPPPNTPPPNRCTRN